MLDAACLPQAGMLDAGCLQFYSSFFILHFSLSTSHHFTQ
jgi:hypothetical protein